MRILSGFDEVRQQCARVAALALCAMFTGPAGAHHAIGGRIPSNGWEGLLSGLAHPVLGLDHFAFVVAVGLIAAVLCAGGALVFPPSFFRAYLSATIFWLGIPVGCLALLMLHHLVGGRWGFMIQRVLEAAIQTLPLMALLFIPLFFGLSDLYPWARTEVVANDHAMIAVIIRTILPMSC